MTLSRRDAFNLGGLSLLGAAALTTPLGSGAQAKSASRLSSSNFPQRYVVEITKQPAAEATMVDGVAHYDLTMSRVPLAQVLTTNLKTPVFGYDGVFPGPRIELDRGTPAVMRLRNHLPAVGPFGSPAATSTHLHGSASLPEYDGYARDTTQQFMIDDTTWEDVVESEFSKVMADPGLGDVEIWELENSSGGWFHPVHVHLVDFRILKRIGGAGKVLPHEQGPKDVVYVGEGETVHLLVKFNAPGGDPEFKGGRYMVHCHNLPHEDHDMMGQFSIGHVDLHGDDPHHPIEAAPPESDPTYSG